MRNWLIVLLHFACRKVQCIVSYSVLFEGRTLKEKKGVTSHSACCKLCSETKGCAAWTHVSKSHQCLMKGATGWTRKSHRGAVSGVVKRNVTSPAPAPSRSPAAAPPAQAPVLSAVNGTGSSSNIFTGANLTPLPVDGKSFTSAHYADVLGLSWMFYEAQRSGPVPANNRISWRGASHTTDPIPGGWYDAGDYLKLNFPLASVVSFLAWGMLEFKDGYTQARQTQYALDNLYIAVDYLKRSHNDTRSYIGQIGHPGKRL